MAQNVTIAGASYSDVPSIQVPKTGGGTASFIDTSDADATAADILTGKTAYVGGTKLTGTGSGGGGSSTKYGVSIDNMFGDLSSGTYQLPAGGNVDLVITDIKKIASYGFHYRFNRNDALRSVNFADLEELTETYAMQYAFATCTKLQSVTFPKLVTINAASAMVNCFNGCTTLTSVSFPSLQSISSSNCLHSVFYGCSKLTTAEFPELIRIGPETATTTNNRHFYQAFYGTTAFTSVSFPKLTAIYCNGTGATYGTFSGCTGLKKIYLPKCTTISKTSGYSNAAAAQAIFNGCSSLTEIHFASANKTAIQATGGYSSKWGASSATIYFDL